MPEASASGPSPRIAPPFYEVPTADDVYDLLAGVAGGRYPAGALYDLLTGFHVTRCSTGSWKFRNWRL